MKKSAKLSIETATHKGTLEITLSEQTAHDNSKTIDLKPISGTYYRLSISGSTKQKGVRGGESWGQCREAMKEDGLLASKDLSRLAALWERWHLNDLNAGTRKQRAKIRKAGFIGDYDKQLETLGDLATERGYKYGQWWLVEVIPEKVIQEIISLVERLGGVWKEE
jgi:hypothetical protein